MSTRVVLALALALALSSVTAFAQSDPDAYHRLSQEYAAANRPLAALDAIESALALSPDSVEFLRARGTLATWAGDYDRAQDSYRRLRKLQPADHEVLLNLARVTAWGGRTDAAVEAYHAYLRVEPHAASVWIELVRTESWRGNYAGALEQLARYQAQFGADEHYAREKAAVLARSGRPSEALETLAPMLRQYPDDYELNLTRTIALAMQRRTRDAWDALDQVRRLQPNTHDTQSAERLVRTNLASSADPGVSVYGDSSGLEIQRVAPRATMSFANGTKLGVGSQHERLWAPRGSPLAQVDGSETARHDQVWISAAQQIGGISIQGRIGQSRAAGRDLTTYAIGAELTPVDALTLSLERSSGFFVVSPRSVGLGLQHVSQRVWLEWSPTLRGHIAVDAWYQTLSDGNRRWELTISPRRSVARTERLNLDLGGVVAHQHANTNFEHGYYDPNRYQYYALTAFPYWKVRESIGIGLSLAAGTQRDDFSPRFRFGGNASAEATFGAFEPWALKLTGGATFNQRLGSGAFRGYGLGVSLVRRFE